MEDNNVKWSCIGTSKGSHEFKEDCYICNNWILKDELCYMIVVPINIRKHCDIEHFMVHKDEWDEFTKDLSDKEIAIKLLNYKKPRRKTLTEEQAKLIEIFKETCNNFGFNKYIMSKNKRFVKMKKRNLHLH